MVGATEVTYRQMLATWRRLMGLSPAFAISVPAGVMRAVSAVSGRFPGSILTPDTWRMLERGNTADVQSTINALGRMPRSIETFIPQDIAPMLRAGALSVWHRLMLLVALAIIWMGSAFVSAVVHPHSASLTLLGRFGLHGTAAEVALYGACALDFGLGIATLATPRRSLWRMQIIVILAYSTLIAAALPEYLSNPFGPILKNIPILAILVLLYSEETHS